MYLSARQQSIDESLYQEYGFRLSLLGALFSLVVFRAILDLLYYFYLVPVFEFHYLTPTPLNFNLFQYCVSWVLVFLGGLVASYDAKNLSGIFFMSACMFLYIPMTTLYGLNFYLTCLPVVYTLLALLMSRVSSKLPFEVFLPKLLNVNPRVAVVFFSSFLFLFVVWSLISGATSTVNFDLDRIYEFRAQAQSMLDVGIMAYINIWTQKVFNPLLFLLALYRKNKTMILITVLMQIYFFGITHHRAHLFTLVLVYMAFLLYYRKISIARLYILVSSLLAVFFVFTFVWNLEAISAIIIRRAFFVPASVSFQWFDYFSAHPKVYWSDNFLSSIAPSEYSGSPLPLFLGDFFSPGSALGFNTGIVASGFAQAGFLGVLIYAFILGGVLSLANAMIRRGVPAYIVAAILFGPIQIAWTSSDLFTSLLTHGILVSIFSLWLFGSGGVNFAKKKK